MNRHETDKDLSTPGAHLRSRRVRRHYAGFWLRLLAAIIDYVIVLVVYFAVSLFVGVVVFDGALIEVLQPDFSSGTGVLLLVFGTGLRIGYYTFTIGRYGASVGMMAMEIQVIKTGGGKVSYARALSRYLASFLSATLLGIGYLMIAFDPKKRALHDWICCTRVIKKDT